MNFVVKKGSKILRMVFSSHSRTGVHHLQEDIGAGHELLVQIQVRQRLVGHGLAASPHPDGAAAIAYRLGAVDNQVHHDLLDLARIGQEARAVSLVEIQLDLHVGRDRRTDQSASLNDHIRQVQPFQVEPAFARIGQKLPRQFRRALSAAQKRGANRVDGGLRELTGVLEFDVANLEFLVDCGQLFVAGLEFFLGTFQLFIEAVQFLICRYHFLVGRFLLNGARFQVRPGGGKFSLQAADAFLVTAALVRSEGPPAFQPRRRLPLILKHNQKLMPVRPEWRDVDAAFTGRAAVRKAQRFDSDRVAGLASLPDRASQGLPVFFVDGAQKFPIARLTPLRREFEIAVDDHPGRAVLLNHDPVGLMANIDSARRPRRR